MDDELPGPLVVLVDDSPSILGWMESLVAEHLPGCRSQCFTDPLAALDFCLNDDPDLIVVDYVMPKLDGLRFIETLHRDPRDRSVPTVMVTSQLGIDLRRAALKTGVTDFLNKPVDEVEFVMRVRNLLGLSRSRRALAERNRILAAEVREATRETIHVLARAAEHRDNETGAHLVRMAEYSRMIAQGIGLDRETAATIQTAAPMHDIGKIGIPDEILLKPGPLTHDEMERMRRHARYGWDILNGSNSPLLQTAAEIALCHHERYDGQGYPQGLAGEAIPLVGRIVALADVFDALTSVRPYKPAWSLEESRARIISQSGLHFDPTCVAALLDSWSEVTVIAESAGAE